MKAEDALLFSSQSVIGKKVGIEEFSSPKRERDFSGGSEEVRKKWRQR